MNKKILLRIDDVFGFLVFLYPIVRYYMVPLIGMSFEAVMAILLFTLGFLLFIKRFYWMPEIEQCKSQRRFFLFVLWAFAITAYYELFTEYNMSNSLANYNMNSLVIFFMSGIVIYFIIRGVIDTENCLRIYTGFVYLILAIVILQWLLLFIGVRLSFKLPFEYTSDWSYMTNKIFGMNSYPTGLFSERSHLCEYVCPYIGLCLFSKNLVKRNRMRNAILLSIIVIATASGNGIIILLVEWALWFLGVGQDKEKMHLLNRIIIVIVGVIALISIYLILLRIPRFSEMFSKLFVDSSGSQYSSSKADYRIYRGFDIYFRLPVIQKLAGVGYRHMYMFSESNGIKSVFDYFWHDVYEYFSALSMVLLYFGFFGVYLFLSHLWELCKSKIDVVRGIIIVMVALFLSCEMLLNYSHIMFMLIIMMAFTEEKRLLLENSEMEGGIQL